MFSAKICTVKNVINFQGKRFKNKLHTVKISSMFDKIF